MSVLNPLQVSTVLKMCEQRLSFLEGISLVYIQSKVTSLHIIMFLVHQLSLYILVSSNVGKTYFAVFPVSKVYIFVEFTYFGGYTEESLWNSEIFR